MKLRINLNANTDEDKNDLQKAATDGDTKSNDGLLLDSDAKKRSSNVNKTAANVAPIFLNLGAKRKVDKVVAEARAKFLHSDQPELLKSKAKEKYLYLIVLFCFS